MKLADNLKRFRMKKELSVRALAREAGVSQPYLRQLEMGIRDNPSGAILERIARVLGVTIADLLGAPVKIPEDSLSTIPPSLAEFARKRGRALGLRREDVEVLKKIHYRGRQFERPEDWEILFVLIRRMFR